MVTHRPSELAISFKDSPRQIISGRQAGRRSTIPTRTYVQERLEVLEDLQRALIPEATQKQIMAAADDYFRGMMNKIKDPEVRKSIFGEFK